MTSTPLVVAVLKAAGENPDYDLYCAAYGLEMQIDNEWNAELVLLTPSGRLNIVTKTTDVTGPDTRIVSAGVIDVPLTPNGRPELSEIDDERNNWLLVAGSGLADTEDVIRAKLHTALATGRRVVLCFTDADVEQLSVRFQGIDSSALGRLVVAYTEPGAIQPEKAEYGLRITQDSLRSVCGTIEGLRVIVGGRMTVTDAVALVAIPGIAGVFMQADEYEGFGDILQVLAALGDSRQV